MCTKKEYTCYEGKEVADCCNSRVKEAVKRRTTNILLIASVAFLIITLVTKTVDNKIFVDQVSFASTITSIILSVIAIWMSITGERSTNEIKSKVSDAVERLIKTTCESEILAGNLEDTLKNQNEIYMSMQKNMSFLMEEVHGVKDSVELLNSLVNNSDTEETIKKSEDVLTFFDNTFNHLGDYGFKKDFLYLVSYVFEKDMGYNVETNELTDLMIKRGVKRQYMFSYVTLLIVFAKNGFFVEKNNFNEIKMKYKEYFD